MARRKSKRPTPKGAQWVQLINAFRAEPAWKALSSAARVVYIELKGLFNGSNNGSIEASVRWLAGATGLSKNTVGRALKQLEAYGFIVPMRRGCVGVEGKGEATLWRLTELGYAGERPTKDYRQWKPEKKARPLNGHGTSLIRGRWRSLTSQELGRTVSEMGTEGGQNRVSRVPEMGTIYNLPWGAEELRLRPPSAPQVRWRRRNAAYPSIKADSSSLWKGTTAVRLWTASAGARTHLAYSASTGHLQSSSAVSLRAPAFTSPGLVEEGTTVQPLRDSQVRQATSSP